MKQQFPRVTDVVKYFPPKVIINTHIPKHISRVFCGRCRDASFQTRGHKFYELLDKYIHRPAATVVRERHRSKCSEKKFFYINISLTPDTENSPIVTYYKSTSNGAMQLYPFTYDNTAVNLL